jgi:hypothetical protein
MNYFRSQRFKDIAGTAAALIIAITSLAAAIYHVYVVLDLKQNGSTVDARVIDIERGARNSKWAVYDYTTEGGQQTVARDIFQQYIKRVRKGQDVRVIYLDREVKTVTADLGVWIWQAPAIFFCGFFILAVIAFFIWRARST